MTFARVLVLPLFVVISACGGPSSTPSATAPPPASPGSTAPAVNEAAAAPAPPPAAGSAVATSSVAAPMCVAQGKPCTVGDTYCCYGSCHVVEGSATPVCAP